MLMEWFMGEADKRSDRYLATFAGSRLVLYAGRVVLAVNRMLYPYHKWFLHRLGQAPLKPEGLIAQIEAVLADPCAETAQGLAASVVSFSGIELEMGEAVSRFVHRSEWNWRGGRAPLEDA
jgi:hypothetical protein